MRGRMSIDIQGLDETLEYMNTVGDRALQATAKAITTASVLVQRTIMRNVRKRFTQRTGKLRKSWTLRIITKRKAGAGQLAGGTATGIIGSDHPGARVQDEGTGYLPGGRIVPRKKAALTIPVSDEARGKKARDFGNRIEPISNWLARESGTTTGALVERSGRNLITHYLLRQSVVLKGRHYVTDAVEEASPKVAALVGDQVDILIKRGR